MSQNPSWPLLVGEFNPSGALGYGTWSANTYTDLTARLVQQWGTSRGRQFELDEVQPERLERPGHPADAGPATSRAGAVGDESDEEFDLWASRSARRLSLDPPHFVSSAESGRDRAAKCRRSPVKRGAILPLLALCHEMRVLSGHSRAAAIAAPSLPR